MNVSGQKCVKNITEKEVCKEREKNKMEILNIRVGKEIKMMGKRNRKRERERERREERRRENGGRRDKEQKRVETEKNGVLIKADIMRVVGKEEIFKN